MNFCTFDPGRETGCAVWSDAVINTNHPARWELLSVGTLRYTSPRDFLDRLEAIKRNYLVAFAIIERYVNYGKLYRNAERMITQQELICSVFPDCILIPKCSWDPNNTMAAFQAQIIKDWGIDCPPNEHERDAVHMGLNIFRRLPADNDKKAIYLRIRSQSDHNIGQLM
jgi:hypothetical protein